MRFKAFLWWDAQRLTLPAIKKYARAVQDQVGAEGVWGFIDGTMRPFCRPGEQEVAGGTAMRQERRLWVWGRGDVIVCWSG